MPQNNKRKDNSKASLHQRTLAIESELGKIEDVIVQISKVVNAHAAILTNILKREQKDVQSQGDSESTDKVPLQPKESRNPEDIGGSPE